MRGVDVQFPSPVIGASKTLGHFVDQVAFERYVEAYRAAAQLLPPAEARTVTTSFGLVQVYQFSSADTRATGRTPVVLMSGRDSATPMWAPALDDLLTMGRPLYALDSVGGPGCSSQARPLTTSQDQAAWVAEVVRGLGLGRVHLVGHSLGGWLATQVAIHHPDVLASVTTLDPPRAFTELSLKFVAAGLTASVPAVPARLRRSLIGWIAGAPMNQIDPIDRLGWTSIQTFRVRQQPPQLPDRADLSSIEAPMLAILAGRSRVHDAQKAARGTNAVPGAQVEIWSDVGHCLHAERPRRLAVRLQEFTDGLGP